MPATDPNLRTLSYGLAPGGGDEEIDVQSEEMLVNMGPQHPSTHGVLRIVLRTDGELVLEAVPHLGFLHRCKEKIGENLPYYQFIGYTDRLDYLSAMNNNHAWSMAVEKLAGIEIPIRAQFIRVLAAELNRIASHLVSFGTYGMDMGAFTPFLYAFREREYILDLFEQLCGARLTLSYINVGGVTWDLPPLFLEKLAEFLDYFEPKIDEYNDLLSFNHIFIKRTANVGIVSREQCIGYSLTGPMIRGSGIPLDLRRDRPYSIYDQLDFDVCIGQGLRGTIGDCWDRYWVKMQEMKQCIKILRQCIARMPDGAFRAKLPRVMKVPPGEVYEEYENPRGHLGFFIESQGGPIPYRVKIRGPSFVNLAVIGELCRGVLLADVPAIIGSIDIVMGEVDPVVDPYAIIVGFGLPGRASAEALDQKKIPYCVIELNASTVTRCARTGIPIIEGNVTEPGILEKAGVERATLIVIAVPDEEVSLRAVELARARNPHAKIIARCVFTSAGLRAKHLGADEVVAAEKVVAEEFFRRIRA